MTKATIVTEKSLCGWLTLSAVHKGQRIERKFCGYSLREAKRMFNQIIKKS